MGAAGFAHRCRPRIESRDGDQLAAHPGERGEGDDRADDARVNLAAVERFLTPAQVAEGQRLAHLA